MDKRPNAKFQEVTSALIGRAFSQFLGKCVFTKFLNGDLNQFLCVLMKLPDITPCFVQEHQQLIQFTRQLRLHDGRHPFHDRPSTRMLM